MNGYQPIESVVGRLKNEFDWTHSFIRECYFTSAHVMCEYVDSKGDTQIGDVDGPQTVRLIVACAGNEVDLGIEFVFRNVRVFSAQAFRELQFQYDYNVRSGHLVRFSATEAWGECYITAESVFVRFLGRDYTGMALRLGHECPTPAAREAKVIEGCWRQCPNCSNAWEENPRIEFSRCPDCGELTRLTT